MKVGSASRNHPLYHREVDDTVDDRMTDAGLWLEITSRYGPFTIDAAAAPHNALLPRFWTRADDALKQPWRDERVWCNPPYSNLLPWVEKAWAEHRNGCALIVMLLPALRMDQQFWQRHVEPYRDRPGTGLRCEFLPGRPRFRKPDGSSWGRTPFGLVLLIWASGGQP